MTLPQGPVQIPQDTLTSYIRSMQAQVDEATRQTMYSAVVSSGGLTIRQGGSFVITNLTGSYNVLETKTRTFGDGTSYQPVVINRPPTGEPAFAVYPTASTATQPFFWAMFDRNGHFILTDDAASGLGLSKPYLDVTMYSLVQPPAVGGNLSYTQVNNASGNQNTPVWKGKIPYVSHPYLYMSGLWGWASGGSGNITYTVTAGSASWSWTQSTLGWQDPAGMLDLRSQIGATNLDITLSVSAVTSPTGQIACQVSGCYLRGT